jgi:hypothetical protein
MLNVNVSHFLVHLIGEFFGLDIIVVVIIVVGVEASVEGRQRRQDAQMKRH